MISRVSDSKVYIRNADDRDKSRLANLIHFESYVHRHLDWRQPLEWIDHQPFLILERNDQMIGALACPPDPPTTAWIRLFAMSSLLPINDGWDRLWQVAKEILLENRSIKIFAIPLQEWFISLLKRTNFYQVRDVLILLWEHGLQIPTPTNSINIRPMRFGDLPMVHEIDNLAFEEEWRNSQEAIETAFQQASLATVAINIDKILGYQISTGGPQGGHLARLAVRPDEQMKGIGYSLVYDLLVQFNHRGIMRVTVNTQHDNIASLKLYEKAKFFPTGEIFPVFQYLEG